MPRAQAKRKARANRSGPARRREGVLTLAEAAAYLRLSAEQVVALVTQQDLPGRRVGTEWRFLKAAVQDWLQTPDPAGFRRTHFGALRDDPYREEMLRGIYERRGRPMTEDG